MKRVLIAVLSIGYVLVTYGIASKAVDGKHWPAGQFCPVESYVFDSAKYDPDTETLTLLFRTGDVYEYYGVSRKTWLTFMRVQYKGSFFNAHIRRAYDYARVGFAP